MERSVWTDERLSDRFDHIDRELSDLRSEMRDLRLEMREGFADLRSLMIRLHLGTLIPMLGLFAALVARGG
jgi:hypothetical protein